jgi:Transposase DDE domain group 1
MQTECNPNLFDFARVENRTIVASFDGGRITSDAGALLLGAANRVLGLTRRFAACFKDSRDPVFVEHSVQTLVTQRIVGIALGYGDLIDHDESWLCWLASLKPAAATAPR